MNIIVNGEPLQTAENATLQQLLEQLRLQDKRLAVELNLAIVPRSRYGECRLQDGDRLEIVHAIGGGQGS